MITDTRSTSTSTSLRLTPDRSYWIQVAAINTSGLGTYTSTAVTTSSAR